MEYYELKLAMRNKARLLKGFITLLEDDVKYIQDNINDFNVNELNESILEFNHTVHKLMDLSADLEYYMHLIQRDF